MNVFSSDNELSLYSIENSISVRQYLKQNKIKYNDSELNEIVELIKNFDIMKMSVREKLSEEKEKTICKILKINSSLIYSIPNPSEKMLCSICLEQLQCILTFIPADKLTFNIVKRYFELFIKEQASSNKLHITIVNYFKNFDLLPNEEDVLLKFLSKYGFEKTDQVRSLWKNNCFGKLKLSEKFLLRCVAELKEYNDNMNLNIFHHIDISDNIKNALLIKSPLHVIKELPSLKLTHDDYIFALSAAQNKSGPYKRSLINLIPTKDKSYEGALLELKKQKVIHEIL